MKNANFTTWYYGNLQQVLTSKLWFHMRQMKPFLSWLVIFAVFVSAANRLIGEVVQSRRRPLLGPSSGLKRLLALSHLLRHYAKRALTQR